MFLCVFQRVFNSLAAFREGLVLCEANADM